MAVEFAMPKLGLTMEEGLILEWLVPDGGDVTEGMPVLIVQTDKVDTEVEAVGSGRLAHIGKVGETYACGQQIGWFLGEGEKVPVVAAAEATPVIASSAPPQAAVNSPSTAPTAPAVVGAGVGGRRFVSPNAKRVAAQLGVDLAAVQGTGPDGRVVSEDVERAHASGPRTATMTAAPSAPRVARAPGETVLASYAATSLAELIGIDVRDVPAAPGQRLEKDDVVAYIRALIAPSSRAGSAPGSSAAASPTIAAAPPVPVLAPATQTPSSINPMTGMRGVIASRMHESLREMAQLTLTMDADMSEIVRDREARKKKGNAPGYTDYVIAAAAKALREKPFANSQIVSEGVALLPDIHVGMAVALENGLVVPVIRNTDKLSIDELSAETTRLATAARAGKLKLAEMEGGTFSVTALGMFGVDAFTPVINPPNTAILGVGRLRDDVAWDAKGKPVKATRLTLSLTWDHRAFDGAPAAEFCAHIRSLLEAPAQFL